MSSDISQFGSPSTRQKIERLFDGYSVWKRLLALVHRFDELARMGVANDYADLARLEHVTRARVTQIMNLLGLAPDIQEQILFSPPVNSGKARSEARIEKNHGGIELEAAAC